MKLFLFFVLCFSLSIQQDNTTTTANNTYRVETTGIEDTTHKIDITTFEATTEWPTTIKDSNTYLSVTAISYLEEVHIDGVDVPLEDLYPAPYRIPVGNYSRLYTFAASTPVGVNCFGIAGSVDNNLMKTSASSCKCTSTPGNGYTQLGFDDSLWSPAFDYGSYGSSHCGVYPYPYISADARWIWSDGNAASKEITFCRCYSDTCKYNNVCLNGGTCNRNSVDLCTCTEKYSGVYCETEKKLGIAVTAKEHLQNVYIDGLEVKPLVNADVWNSSMLVTSNLFTRLIAISAVNVENFCSGILASTDDDYSYSSAAWRCTAANEFNWYSLDFDDTHWPAAAVVGNNTNGLNNCPSNNPVAGISGNAQWIWTRDSTQQNTLVYCRGYLPACTKSPCNNGGKCSTKGALCACLPGYSGQYCDTVTNLYLAMTAMYNLDGLFIDGVQNYISNANDYNLVGYLFMNPLTRLIAVYADAVLAPNASCHGVLAGVTISAQNYSQVTNSAWNCINTANVNWYKLGFTDTWPQAVALGPNGALPNCPVRNITQISGYANWIWNSNSPTVTFCRFYLPICNYMPCQNGGTCNKNAPLLCTCPTYYAGQFCEIDTRTISTYKSDCGSNGYLVSKNREHFCKCNHGFKGKHCERKIQKCEPNTCGANGTCRELASKVVCLCNRGFSGPRCT